MASKFVQGYYTPINPEKYKGTSKPMFRSSWEFKVMQLFDTNPNFISWASEAIKIPYKNPFTGKNTVYVPDFLVTYTDSKGVQRSEIIEIKPAKETFMEMAKTQKSKAAVILNTFKWAAANAFAKQHGLKFRIMNENHIFNNPNGKS